MIAAGNSADRAVQTVDRGQRECAVLDMGGIFKRDKFREYLQTAERADILAADVYSRDGFGFVKRQLAVAVRVKLLHVFTKIRVGERFVKFYRISCIIKLLREYLAASVAFDGLNAVYCLTFSGSVFGFRNNLLGIWLFLAAAFANLSFSALLGTSCLFGNFFLIIVP